MAHGNVGTHKAQRESKTSAAAAPRAARKQRWSARTSLPPSSPERQERKPARYHKKEDEQYDGESAIGGAERGCVADPYLAIPDV